MTYNLATKVATSRNPQSNGWDDRWRNLQIKCLVWDVCPYSSLCHAFMGEHFFKNSQKRDARHLDTLSCVFLKWKQKRNQKNSETFWEVPHWGKDQVTSIQYSSEDTGDSHCGYWAATTLSSAGRGLSQVLSDDFLFLSKSFHSFVFIP